MYVCTHIHIYVHTCICTLIHIHTYIYMGVLGSGCFGKSHAYNCETSVYALGTCMLKKTEIIQIKQSVSEYNLGIPCFQRLLNLVKISRPWLILVLRKQMPFGLALGSVYPSVLPRWNLFKNYYNVMNIVTEKCRLSMKFAGHTANQLGLWKSERAPHPGRNSAQAGN